MRKMMPDQGRSCVSRWELCVTCSGAEHAAHRSFAELLSRDCWLLVPLSYQSFQSNDRTAWQTNSTHVLSHVPWIGGSVAIPAGRSWNCPMSPFLLSWGPDGAIERFASVGGGRYVLTWMGRRWKTSRVRAQHLRGLYE